MYKYIYIYISNPFGSQWQVSFFGYDDLWHEMDRQIEETPMPLECRLEYEPDSRSETLAKHL